jgi:hypothetical protein
MEEVDGRATRNERGSLVRCMLVLGSLAFSLGCNKGESNRAEVTGSVLVDGNPAATGAISFMPVDGKSPTSGGKIVAGKYSVEVPFGTSKVAIRVPKVVGQRKLYDTPDSPVQPLMEETLPPEFNDRTELTLDVKPGVNERVFDLKAKKTDLRKSPVR